MNIPKTVFIPTKYEKYYLGQKISTIFHIHSTPYEKYNSVLGRYEENPRYLERLNSWGLLIDKTTGKIELPQGLLIVIQSLSGFFIYFKVPAKGNEKFGGICGKFNLHNDDIEGVLLTKV
jgi:hypothetical protein